MDGLWQWGSRIWEDQPDLYYKIGASVLLVLALWLIHLLVLRLVWVRTEDPKQRYRWRKGTGYALLATGVLGGLLGAYTPPALAFPVAFGLVLASSAPDLWQTLRRSALHGGAALLAFLASAPVVVTLQRLADESNREPERVSMLGQLSLAAELLFTPRMAWDGSGFIRHGYARLLPHRKFFDLPALGLSTLLWLVFGGTLALLMARAVRNTLPTRARALSPAGLVWMFLGWFSESWLMPRLADRVSLPREQILEARRQCNE